MKKMTSFEISERLERLRSELGEANLLAVSKYSEVDEILSAHQASQRDFGENRVQDLERKALDLQGRTPDIRWHFIGQIQSNKINKLLACPHLYAIHSVDSLKKLGSLNKKMDHFQGESLKVFLQVKTSPEREKSGFTETSELLSAFQEWRAGGLDSRIHLQGLMTMGVMRTDDFEAEARRCFRHLRDIRDQLQKELPGVSLELSMGMSQDYPLAVEEGADWVRIGSKIFKS